MCSYQDLHDVDKPMGQDLILFFIALLNLLRWELEREDEEALSQW